MKVQVRQELHPYRRFTMILGVTVLVFGIILIYAATRIVNDNVVKDTTEFTQEAVNAHFAALSAFSNSFKNSSGGQAEHEHTGSANYDSLNAVVHIHFDLYNISEARFYYPDGFINYSYDRDEVGQKVLASRQGQLAQALGGVNTNARISNHRLQLWQPIYDSSHKVLGAVEIVRNISEQDNSTKQLIIRLIVIVLLGMFVLFFSLRQIFIRSTRTIDRQNKELQSLITSIERTYDQSLQALSSALDSRDHETRGHSFRVTSYSIRLGKEMGLSPHDLGFLARGALLHDVGKIGVPDAILLKPDKLTPEEWIHMKKHVQNGYEMLGHIEFLESSMDVVKYHHERWDGNGYPFQLKAEQIPLFAQIFAICDTYDAMTSDRPYRLGRSYFEAREEIVRCSGTQFSPQVVEAFLRIPEDQWLAIKQLSVSGKDDRLLDQMLELAHDGQKAS